MRFTVADIASIAGGRLVSGEGSAEATGVSTDSRKVSEGDLFVAIKGDRFDGHDFISTAIEKGAAAVLVEGESPDCCAGIRAPVVSVTSSIDALAKLASSVRDSSDIPWVATTGSAGKTTTKEMIAAALAPLGGVLKAPASFNNNIGVPLTILGLRERHRAASLEIGTNSPGEINTLSVIARPDIAVITNIGPAHIGAFGDLQSIAQEKSAILRHVTEDGVAILPADSCHFEILKSATERRTITFGIGPLADIRADSVETMDCGETLVRIGESRLRLRSTGMGNVRNALAAIAVARELGVGDQEAIDALGAIEPPSMRGRIKRGNGLSVLDHSYNANPISFTSALESLFLFPTEGRRWVVAGDMLELGESAAQLHVELGSTIARTGASKLLAVGDFAPQIALGAVQGGMGDVSITQVSTANDATTVASDIARDGDLILVKGSRAVGLESVVDVLLGGES